MMRSATSAWPQGQGTGTFWVGTTTWTELGCPGGQQGGRLMGVKTMGSLEDRQRSWTQKNQDAGPFHTQHQGGKQLALHQPSSHHRPKCDCPGQHSPRRQRAWTHWRTREWVRMAERRQPLSPALSIVGRFMECSVWASPCCTCWPTGATVVPTFRRGAWGTEAGGIYQPPCSSSGYPNYIPVPLPSSLRSPGIPHGASGHRRLPAQPPSLSTSYAPVRPMSLRSHSCLLGQDLSSLPCMTALTPKMPGLLRGLLHLGSGQQTALVTISTAHLTVSAPCLKPLESLPASLLPAATFLQAGP